MTAMGASEIQDSARGLSIILPAFNEAANIVTAVTSALAAGHRFSPPVEVIVVDDGSSDATASVVQQLAEGDNRVRLVRHPVNQGYGDALKSGFAAARMPLVFFTDADNQFDLDELGTFVDLIDRVDVVAGYRINRCDPWFRRLNAAVWNYVVRALYYVPVRDIDCAFKMFRREVFDGLQLDSMGAMVNTELMVKLGRSGYRVVEVGVHHYPRRAGVARGANLRVIARALVELVWMHTRLSRMDLTHTPTAPTTTT
jgi:glycosyltransferase involved in cell wall biosynthesis